MSTQGAAGVAGAMEGDRRRAGRLPVVLRALVPMAAAAFAVELAVMLVLGGFRPTSEYLAVALLDAALVALALLPVAHLLIVRPLAAQIERRRRAEAALRRSEERLRGLFDNAALGIVEVDTDNRLTAVNEPLSRILGRPRAELVGTSLYDITAAEDRERTRELHAKLRTGELDRFEYTKRYLKADGSPLWAHVTVSAVRDHEGRFASAVGTVEDVGERHRMEEKLRRSEELLRVAAQAAEIGVWRWVPATGEVAVDSGWRALFGFRPDEAVSFDAWAARLHPEDRGGVLARLEDVARAPREFRYEYRIVRRDGSLVWIGDRGGPCEACAPGVVTMAGVNLDITERKQAEERIRGLKEDLERRNAELQAERARWQGLVEGIVDEVWTADREGRLSLANRPRVSPFGLEGMRDRPLEDVLREVDILEADGTPRTAQNAPVARALRGEVVRGEETARERATGRVHHRQYTAAPLRDAWGGIVGAVAVVRDVTEQRRAEQGLREADRRKGEFLAMLSHELRNPLAPVRSSLYVLERAPAGSAQAHRAVAVIGRQVDHLTRLVDDLLDVTRISRGKIQLQKARTDVAELARRAAEDRRSLFAQGGVALEVEARGPLWVDGDATRLSQVIGNLLHNAAKFTGPGGRTTLLADRDEQGRVRLRVRDTGAGLRPELLERIFEPFTQAEATLDRRHGGLGLGLALVKSLAELHGGSVRAESAGPGRGSEFTVTLPAAPPPESRQARREAPAPHRSRRVLVIEDNADSAQSLKEVLELEGHEVAVAGDGPEGLRQARAFRPQMVLCDLGLPGIDGYEVARRMQADPELRAVPLVALSGYASPEDVERSREAGFRRHLAKPPDLESLERTISEVPEGEPAQA